MPMATIVIFVAMLAGNFCFAVVARQDVASLVLALVSIIGSILLLSLSANRRIRPARHPRTDATAQHKAAHSKPD